MTARLLATILFVARSTAIDLAYELRRDLERGVFDQQTLAVIGVFLIVAIVAVTHRAWGLSVTAGSVGGLMTYTVARADRRWRDDRRTDL
ncbi:hypothetical protein [Natrinema versiforme]|uniref:MgtC/SapB family protein n=1 Tax=Natrinema versiforme TaxID=88724 RepID=A0A4P8WL61_9EURY|nr:hypothetical protein [Natrinema versiforme]QCS42651.1 hypothetical protein FEJ81_09880 [Natrinema versiforme]